MKSQLKDLNAGELRNLLSQETRKFLWILDFNGPVEDLENVRTRLRAIADLLKEKDPAGNKKDIDSGQEVPYAKEV